MHACTANRTATVNCAQIFYHVFRERCKQPGNKRGLFLDVGANFGWFSILAGSEWLACKGWSRTCTACGPACMA